MLLRPLDYVCLNEKKLKLNSDHTANDGSSYIWATLDPWIEGGQLPPELNQIEPNLPWQNTAEGAVRKPKKGSSRKMIRTGSPKKLWDHSLEQQALVRPNTYNGAHILNGETPRTFMREETADISRLYKFDWFEWTIFHDSPVQYHEEFVTLGYYLGPSPGVGSYMIHNILKTNG